MGYCILGLRKNIDGMINHNTGFDDTVSIHRIPRPILLIYAYSPWLKIFFSKYVAEFDFYQSS